MGVGDGMCAWLNTFVTLGRFCIFMGWLTIKFLMDGPHKGYITVTREVARLDYSFPAPPPREENDRVSRK